MLRLALLAAAVCLSACSVSIRDTWQQTPASSFSYRENGNALREPAIEEKTSAIAPALNSSGFKLLTRVAAPGENAVVSPTSMGQVLMMASLGAGGQTRAALAHFLALPIANDQSPDDWITAVTPQNSNSAVKIQVANSIWTKTKAGKLVNPAYTSDVTRLFGAEVGYFKDPADGARKINNWVWRKSDGKIAEVVPSLRPDSDLCLVNTTTFVGRWNNVFKKSETSDRPFYETNERSHIVPMMQQSGNFDYASSEGFQVISLPYEHSYHMLIFLPKSTVSVAPILDNSRFDRLTQALERRQGTLLLPRFTADFKRDWSSDLKALGLEIAFSERADFNHIAPKVRVTEIWQQAKVKVDEEGTVASAATVLGSKIRSAMGIPETERFYLEVNRPFFFAIADRVTNAILFLGKVSNPTEH